jgi:sugar lactone lactonase YvrE
MLGQILVGDLRTGSYAELVPPTGRMAVGMKFDARSNSLFVAGGVSGGATVYDATSGAEIAFYQLVAPGVTIINDVTVTREAAYFTDSFRPFLGRVALGPNGEPGQGVLVPLPANFGNSGSCTFGLPPRANGIAATPDGKHLIVVHMSEGQLYLFDTTTFATIPIVVSGGDAAGGAAACGGDGLLLDGTTLYVVQAPLNRVAVIEMSADYFSGVVTRYITEPFASNPALQFPTTIAEFGNSLYAVTYGDIPPTPDFVVRLEK